VCEAIREENVCKLLKAVKGDLDVDLCRSLMSSLGSRTIDEVARALGVSASELSRIIDEAEKLLRSGLDDLLDELCNAIGGDCRDVLRRAKRGEVSMSEAVKLIREKGIAKGITDDEVDRMIRKYMTA